MKAGDPIFTNAPFSAMIDVAGSHPLEPHFVEVSIGWISGLSAGRKWTER